MMAPFETPLCELAYKYGTDKCPQLKHAYTPVYYNLLLPYQNKFRKILEFGIGRDRPNRHYVEGEPTQDVLPPLHRGASLYMWRDFFPLAQVYGADFLEETQFSDDRIKTFLLDERKSQDITNLFDTIGSDIDLVVDDASHLVEDQIFLAQHALPLLDKKVIYIIEDVTHSRLIGRALGSEYETRVIDVPRTWRGGMLYLIKKK